MERRLEQKALGILGCVLPLIVLCTVAFQPKPHPTVGTQHLYPVCLTSGLTSSFCQAILKRSAFQTSNPIYLKLHNFPLSINIHQYPSTSINIHQHPSISINIYQYPSTSINIYHHNLSNLFLTLSSRAPDVHRPSPANLASTPRNASARPRGSPAQPPTPGECGPPCPQLKKFQVR